MRLNAVQQRDLPAASDDRRAVDTRVANQGDTCSVHTYYESNWLGTTKIDLRENLSYLGNFLLNRTSEKCHTQQLQTDDTHTCRHTMPCAAASRCKAVPNHTPGPPDTHAKSVGCLLYTSDAADE